ncbi:MAG: hypothetical protein JWO62_3457 [Acidimicrobiaceae bacterium]|nr:hypothetical protein [Acidimicrobiaceae bacterium]
MTEVAPPTFLQLDPADNVVVAVVAAIAGDVLDLSGQEIIVLEEIPFGHKVATRGIGRGEKIVKYGEVIGVATSEIEAGRHVHVHNVASARLPGAEHQS